MRRSIAAYLADIIDACEHIIEVTAGLDADIYLENKTIRRSVERDFQIISEGLIQLRDREPESFAQYQDGAMVIGFRHVLVHQYFDLDYRTVWDTISNDVEPLLRTTHTILAAIADPHND